MKFPLQHPHLTTILHTKILLLLMDILAEAEGLNRAKQNNLLGFTLDHIGLPHRFFRKEGGVKLPVKMFLLQYTSLWFLYPRDQ